MMSWHTPTHSSQMKTVGPAISFRTSFWLLLQNEHRRTSSLFFFTDFLFDAFERLPRVMRENFIQNRPDAKNFFRVDLNVGRLSLDAAHPRLMNKDARVREGEPLFR